MTGNLFCSSLLARQPPAYSHCFPQKVWDFSSPLLLLRRYQVRFIPKQRHLGCSSSQVGPNLIDPTMETCNLWISHSLPTCQRRCNTQSNLLLQNLQYMFAFKACKKECWPNWRNNGDHVLMSSVAIWPWDASLEERLHLHGCSERWGVLTTAKILVLIYIETKQTVLHLWKAIGCYYGKDQ